MAKNKELAQKVTEAIVANPERFYMNRWRDSSDCGTRFCIAGWAVFLGRPDLEGKMEDVRPSADPDEIIVVQKHPATVDVLLISELAQSLLGLNDSEAFELFYKSDWSQPWRGSFLNAETPQERAEVAADYIRHFFELDSEEANETQTQATPTPTEKAQG